MNHWIVFIHILSAFIFTLSHGASTKVILKIKGEKRPERLAALLDLSADYVNVFYASLGVMLLAGIANSFLGKWWGSIWIWVGLALLLVIFSAMYFMGTIPMTRLRNAMGQGQRVGTKSQAANPRASEEEITASLAAIKPGVIAVIGYGGLTLIVWLMVFKPF
jgi:hypothetical protein